MCSAKEAYNQYGHECAALISHIISMDEGVEYGTTKTTQGVGGCILSCFGSPVTHTLICTNDVTDPYCTSVY